MKIGLERVDIQEGIIVEALLDSGATRLVMSSKFAKKTGFQAEEVGEDDECKECRWVAKQGGTYRTHSGSKHLLQRT